MGFDSSWLSWMACRRQPCLAFLRRGVVCDNIFTQALDENNLVDEVSIFESGVCGGVS